MLNYSFNLTIFCPEKLSDKVRFVAVYKFVDTMRRADYKIVFEVIQITEQNKYGYFSVLFIPNLVVFLV